MIGYSCFSEEGVEWRRHHGALLLLGMPHLPPSLTALEIRRTLIKHRGLFARWDEDFDRSGVAEWWHVIKDTPEDFAGLSKNTRSKVRRGARLFDATPVSRDAILSEGYEVYRSAFERYETFEAIFTRERFRQAITDLPGGTEFWAVRDKETGKMVAFSENLVRDGACFYDTIWFQPEALKAYAGYLLIHEMNKHYLNERGLRYVSDGARSISHRTNVHAFLEQKFGFRRAYARLCVIYFPGLGTLVKLLYPFRKWFERRSMPLLQKVAVVLEQERIRRACLSTGAVNDRP